MSPPKAPSKRFLLVDGLRGIAATWVMLFHASEGDHIPRLLAALPETIATIVFHWGKLGVPIFFVLSGFVIAHSLRSVIEATLERTPGLKFFAKFTLKRSVRLDPPYFASIFFVLAFAFVSTKVKHEPFEFPTWDQLLAHFFYAQLLLQYQPISSVYWTLCYEIQFYLVYCLLLITFHRLFRSGDGRSLRLYFVGFLLLSALPWGTGLVDRPILTGLFVDRWHGFVAGALAYLFWQFKLDYRIFVAFLLLIAIPVFVATNLFNATCVLTAALLYCAGRSGRLETYLCSSPIQFSGRISYSLYLLHNPISGAAFFVLYKFLPRSVMTELFALLLVILICFGVAFVYWRALEEPFIRISRKIRLGN